MNLFLIGIFSAVETGGILLSVKNCVCIISLCCMGVGNRKKEISI